MGWDVEALWVNIIKQGSEFILYNNYSMSDYVYVEPYHIIINHTNQSI